jgi:hypothetical protein
MLANDSPPYLASLNLFGKLVHNLQHAQDEEANSQGVRAKTHAGDGSRCEERVVEPGTGMP